MACLRTDNHDKLGTPSMFPGWACCRCRTYNGFQRHTCKNCNHEACYLVCSTSELLPVIVRDGATKVRVDHVPPAPTAKRNKNYDRGRARN